MNPSLLKAFPSTWCPDWVCPSCHSTSLAIQEGTFHSGFVPESRARYRQWDGEVDDLELVFSCLLHCERARCGAVVAVSGSGYVEETPPEAREEGEDAYTEWFKARSFTPPLQAFPIPSGCPDSVRQPLLQAFALFLSAPGAAANTIRIAVEELLTALGIAPGGTLSQRLRALPEAYRDHREVLTAMRLLGNAGSHELDRVTTTDIEEAFTVLEFVLLKIYAGSTESIRQLTARLNERFRPQPRP